MFPIPKTVFLTSGVGVHREQLTAFELALRDADIEQQNLVTVSSILPPGCEQITRAGGRQDAEPGEITFCVMARADTNEPGRRIHASIGLARPTNPAMYGYISEHHGYGMTRDAERRICRGPRRHHAGLDARHRVRSRRRLGRAQARSTRPASSSSTAHRSPPPPQGDISGRWTCAVAAAVFRFA